MSRVEMESSIGRRFSPRLAAGVLALCCVFWGLSFPVMQFASESFLRAVRAGGAEVGVRQTLAVQATFNGWRFALAAGLYWLLTRTRQRGHQAVDWHAGLAVGLFCGGGMFLQLAGLRYTLPSVSGFLTALAVVFAPLAQSAIFRKPVTVRVWLAVAIAILGMLILAAPNHAATARNTLAISPPIPLLGEIMTIVASVLFTGHILSVDRYGSIADTARFTAIMLATVSIVNTAIALALGGAPAYRAQVLAALLRDRVFLGSIVSLVLLSTVVAMHLMNTYQPSVSAAAAAVIYCLEPVFTTLWSVGFRTESLTLITAAGGAVILLAVLIVAQPSPQPRSVSAQAPVT